tara:strand:- start:98 stop:811 length:714 start_codon:yes stop_codon:yes gene_type:complete
MFELSLVIPVLNEEKNIKLLINLIKKNLKTIKYEIIFIDDNSTDNSKKIIKEFEKKNKFIRYFNRKNKNRDLSKSCFIGILKSKYKNILIMDSDLQHHPKYINKMILKMKQKKSDLVICSRKFHDKNKVSGLHLIRYLSSIFLIFIFNLINKNKSLDPMSGFFLFKKEIFIKSKKKMYLKGYKILADLLTNSYRQIKIEHIYIDFYKRKNGQTKMNLSIIFILMLFYLKIIFKTSKY